MSSLQREVAHVDVSHADGDDEEILQREEGHVFVDDPQLLLFGPLSNPLPTSGLHPIGLHFFCNLAYLCLVQ
jgi:hypothetical protein